MLEGRCFTKHARGKGRPAKRAVFVVEAGPQSCVYWAAAGSRQRDPSRCIPIATITDVFEGKHTEPFQRRSADKVEEEVCLSIVSAERTLDLQARNRQERDAFFTGIKSMLAELQSARSKFQSPRVHTMRRSGSRSFNEPPIEGSVRERGSPEEETGLERVVEQE